MPSGAAPVAEAPPRTDPARVDRAGLRAPVIFTLIFSAVFIVRASVTYAGTRYFTLFDDAMISMRYARNLAHGHGLVWNVGGTHVEGYTNFLWTLWMAALHRLGLPASSVALTVILSGVGLLLLNLWLVRAIAEEVAPDRPAVATAALWLTATCYPLLYWTLRGMEVGLLAVVLTAMALVTLRRRHGGQPGLAGLIALGIVAVLTRTDAALPVATVTAFNIAWAPKRDRLRIAVVLLTAFGGTLVAHTAFRWAYYGDPLPNTYYLKLGGAPLGDRLSRGVVSFGALACASLLAPLVLAGFHVYRRRRIEPATALLLALFAVPALYSVYVGGDTWEWMQYANRYLATGLTLLVVVAAVGIDDLLSAPRATQLGALVIGAVLGVLGLVIAVHNIIPTASLQYILSHTDDTRTREAVVGLVVLLLALVAVRVSRGAGGVGNLAAVIVATGLLMSGQAFRTWRSGTGLHVTDDNTMAIYGLELRQATAPDASIAVVWAGDGPYFDWPRPGVDLLGKSDRHIAKEPMRRVQFYPGHTKWDYAWSIGHLQPDVVAGLVRPTPADLADLTTWGYGRLIAGFDGIWVRQSSSKVDRPLLARLVEATPRVRDLVASDL
ncbi:MAG TPA: hypothetical protein VNY84_05950 [Acidimicrobiales bacterium]|nr:hypothetical protein [Acidimicrobiales bacterium]